MKTEPSRNTQPSPRSPMAPAYYLGRPAELWIKAMERRRPLS
jgi:hypothetical protein